MRDMGSDLWKLSSLTRKLRHEPYYLAMGLRKTSSRVWNRTMKYARKHETVRNPNIVILLDVHIQADNWYPLC
jgi:hypothetical protein